MLVILRSALSCRWDLVKRVPKEVLDYLAERAKASAVDDTAIRSQYVACQEWLRCSSISAIATCSSSKSVATMLPLHLHVQCIVRSLAGTDSLPSVLSDCTASLRLCFEIITSSTALQI